MTDSVAAGGALCSNLGMQHEGAEGLAERIVARVCEDSTGLYLLYGAQRVETGSITEAERERLRRIPAHLMVDVDVAREGGELMLRRVGNVQPAWRTVALSAVDDARAGAAREAFAQLGEQVEQDLTLLTARARFHARDEHALGEEDFRKVLAHRDITPAAASEAFKAYQQARRWTEPPKAEQAAFLAYMEQAAVLGQLDQSDPLFHMQLSTIPAREWGIELLVVAIDQCLSHKYAEHDLHYLTRWIEDARYVAPHDPRVPALDARIQALAAKKAEKGATHSGRLRGSPPRFDALEELFRVRLPGPLSKAWEEYYQAESGNHAFIELGAAGPKALLTLARKLERGLERKARRKPSSLLPFAHGPYDGAYYALDLMRRRKDGDFPVRLICFLGLGDERVSHRSSAAFLADEPEPDD